MMDERDNQSFTKLAKMFKDRDNPANFEITTANVIEINPINLKLSEKLFLNKEYENLILSETLNNKTLNVGDEIIVIPLSSGLMWYAIDKAVRL